MKDFYQIGLIFFVEFLESIFLWGNDRIDKVSLSVSIIGKNLANERGIQCNIIKLKFCEEMRFFIISDELVRVSDHASFIISNRAQVFI
jgi:hypothetical protein